MNAVLKEGGWTAALRCMASELMDKMISRPISFVISHPVEKGNVSFNVIKERITDREYEDLDAWRNEVHAVLKKARLDPDPSMNEICDELEQWFDKRFEFLKRLSVFQFKSIATEIWSQVDLDSFDLPE